MRSLLLSLGLLFLAGWASGQTTTTNLALTQPAFNQAGWGPILNTNWGIVDNVFASGTCGDGTHALSYNASTKQLGCQTLAGVTGPGSSTTNDAAGFADTTGKVLKDLGPMPVTNSATSNNFLTGYSSVTGAFTKGQPSFSNLSGSATCAQLPALTGDTTTSAGTCATTTSKLNGTTFAGTNGDVVGFGASNVPVDTSIAFSTLVTSTAPGLGIAHFPGGSQNVTSSLVSLTADVTGILPIANGGTGASGLATTNTTPVTVSNPTINTDTQLMEISLAAGALNVAGYPFLVYGGGVLSSTAASQPAVTITAKICSVSGCGSGTVTPLAAIKSGALNTTAITNAGWSYALFVTVTNTGASCNFMVTGLPGLVIETTASSVGQDSVYSPNNTAVSTPNQNCANALFLDFFVQQTVVGASNSYVQNVGIIKR